MTTTIPAPVTPPTPDLVAFLAEYWGVKVTTASDIPAAQCEWCAEVDAITTVRVIGDPPDDSTAWAARDCCRACTEPVLAAAHAEQREGSRHPIRLELAA